MAADNTLMTLGQYGQLLDGYKEALNQSILAISPESWQSTLASILPTHWQEWLIPLYICQALVHSHGPCNPFPCGPLGS